MLRGTIGNALRVALRINSGKNIYNFGIAERLRALRYPIFTGGVVKANGIYNAASSGSAFQIVPHKRNGSAAVPFCCPMGGIVLY